MDDDEMPLRDALRIAILRVLPHRHWNLPPDIKAVTDALQAGEDDRVALWALMKAAAALGWDVEIGVRRGSGRISVTAG